MSTADSIAMNVVNGNFLHGYSGKHSDVKQSNESGKTCMYPVARITPEAKALTNTKSFLSGCKAGMARERMGRVTPIILATRIAAMAMTLSFKDLVLLWHGPPVAFRHSSGMVLGGPVVELPP